MQRFDPSDLERLEAYLANIGFTPSDLKTHYRNDEPPLLAVTLGGRGDLGALNALLLSSPFLVMDMQTRPTPDGFSVRLKMTSRRPSPGRTADFRQGPEMGDETPVYVAFEPEMGE